MRTSFNDYLKHYCIRNRKLNALEFWSRLILEHEFSNSCLSLFLTLYKDEILNVFNFKRSQNFNSITHRVSWRHNLNEKNRKIIKKAMKTFFYEQIHFDLKHIFNTKYNKWKN